MGAQELGQLHGLVDGDPGGDLGGVEDLVGPKTQDGELYRVHLADGAVQHPVQLRVDLGDVGGHALEQCLEEVQIELEAESSVGGLVLVGAAQRAGQGVQPFRVVEHVLLDGGRGLAG